MKTVAGINGFGRFGLHLLKYWLDRAGSSHFVIGYINDDKLSITKALAIIAGDKYVVFNKHKVSISGDSLVFLEPNGSKHSILYTNRPKPEIRWKGKPDIVFECSGKGTVSKDSAEFLTGNTKLVIISATSWDADKTLVYGFNHDHFTKAHKVISYGSCTVNAYVPLAHYLNKKYGIVSSDVNVIHNIQEYKRGGFNTLNRKFCTLEKSGPNLLGFLNADNFTVNYTVVPYSGVSIMDYRFEFKEGVHKEKFIDDLAVAIAEGDLKGLYGMEDMDIGPEVYNCTTHSAVFIKENIRAVGKNIYLHSYFDNENSVNRFYDLANHVSFKNK